MVVRVTRAGKSALRRDDLSVETVALPLWRANPVVGVTGASVSGAANGRFRQGSPVALARAKKLGHDLMDGVLVMKCLRPWASENRRCLRP
jgi:hypothetical protein